MNNNIIISFDLMITSMEHFHCILLLYVSLVRMSLTNLIEESLCL